VQFIDPTTDQRKYVSCCLFTSCTLWLVSLSCIMPSMNPAPYTVRHLGDVCGGDHVCYFCQSDEEKWRVLCQFYKKGLENNEKMMFFQVVIVTLIIYNYFFLVQSVYVSFYKFADLLIFLAFNARRRGVMQVRTGRGSGNKRLCYTGPVQGATLRRSLHD
jgi:hypothetical protein